MVAVIEKLLRVSGVAVLASLLGLLFGAAVTLKRAWDGLDQIDFSPAEASR